MLVRTRLNPARTAAAFFNMKHFQCKHKIEMSPQSAYATFASNLMPRDRLLRQSVRGGGAGRVLVLDHKQKVKGVYIPVSCIPHPSTIPGGDGSLGITVEDYLKAIQPLASMAEESTVTAALPSVLVVVAHPDGVAFGSFYANGAPAVPLVNTDLSTASSSPISKSGRDANAGLGMGHELRGETTSLNLQVGQLQSLMDRHAEEFARCSTFYWITRDGFDSLTIDVVRRCQASLASMQFVAEGDATASLLLPAAPSPASVSFTDRRWTALQDVGLHTKGPRKIYARDPATRQRIVDADGLRDCLMSGVLMLDHVPRSQKEAASASPEATHRG